MEFIGVTRIVDGKEEDQFVAGCTEHGYYYKGKPPLTHGCRECWTAYFVSEWARGGARRESVDQLEEAIRHAAELADKGQFDFKPEPINLEIEKEN